MNICQNTILYCKHFGVDGMYLIDGHIDRKIEGMRVWVGAQRQETGRPASMRPPWPTLSTSLERQSPQEDVSGNKNGAFGKPCLCPRDTRHFRHFRRFVGFEQQNPCFTGYNANSSFSPFLSKPPSFWRDKGTVYQKHRFLDPECWGGSLGSSHLPPGSCSRQWVK